MKRTTAGPALALLLTACGDPGVMPAGQSEDRALEFDGVDDYATLPTSGFPVGSASQTVSVFLKAARGDAAQSVVTVSRSRMSGVELGLDGATPTAWRVWGRTVFAASPEPLELQRWYHMAYVFDGLAHQLFIDGALVASGTPYANNRSPTLVWLGTLDGASEPFAGQVDELRIWARALAPNEIEGISNGSPLDAAGLVAHLGFDEASGARLLDESPEANDGTLGDGQAGLMPARVRSDRLP